MILSVLISTLTEPYVVHAARFNELVHFAPYLVADEENRVRKFEQGLN
jgi:hypothetical protein